MNISSKNSIILILVKITDYLLFVGSQEAKRHFVDAIKTCFKINKSILEVPIKLYCPSIEARYG